MTNDELLEKIKLVEQCQKVLYELHEELGTHFAKSCADYLDYTLDSLGKPRKKTARKEFPVGQKVQLMDTVVRERFISQLSPSSTYEKGTVGWIANGGHMLCGGGFLTLDSEKVKVDGFDAEGVTEYLWLCLAYGSLDTTLVQLSWDTFSERVEEALHHLNYPIPRNKQPAEITFDDLSKHQFWQDRQDLFKKE